jgi:hypothetical protein
VRQPLPFYLLLRSDVVLHLLILGNKGKITMRYSLRNSLRSLSLLAVLGLAGPLAQAQTTFFQTGFELSDGYDPNYARTVTVRNRLSGDRATFLTAPGALFAQNYVWRFYNNLPGQPYSFEEGVKRVVNNTTVVSGVAAGGTQSLLLNGPGIGSQFVHWDKPLAMTSQGAGQVTLSADMAVTDPSQTDFGQWGIAAYGSLVNDVFPMLGGLGFVGTQIVATDGMVPIGVLDPNTFAPVRAAYGDFHNYALHLDYRSHSFSVLFDGAPTLLFYNNQVVASVPFFHGQDNLLTAVDLGQLRPTGSAESAYIDNFTVRGQGMVPEPGAVALLVTSALCGAGLMWRRTKLMRG